MPAAMPFLDLKANFEGIREELLQAIIEVVESQQFILGPAVRSFEAAVREYLGVKAAISCASGSDALLLSLLALDIGPGDEVITTPFTFFATAGEIVRAGATPVFVDIDKNTFNIRVDAIERSITTKTKAIITVHLFGQMSYCDELLEIGKKHDLAIIEDAAQAIGANYKGRSAGSLGSTGCFSFFPSKNLGGAGDGGMVVTNDAACADKVLLLRTHGSRKKYQYELVGMNSRLDTLQAAILEVKLRYLENWTAARMQVAERYNTLFADRGLADRNVILPAIVGDGRHVFHQYVIRCDARDALREFLLSNGISTEIYYPRPLHLQPAFFYLGYTKGAFPEAEEASEQVLALPIYPELREEYQAAIVRSIAEFYEHRT